MDPPEWIRHYDFSVPSPSSAAALLPDSGSVKSATGRTQVDAGLAAGRVRIPPAPGASTSSTPDVVDMEVVAGASLAPREAAEEYFEVENDYDGDEDETGEVVMEHDGMEDDAMEDGDAGSTNEDGEDGTEGLGPTNGVEYVEYPAAGAEGLLREAADGTGDDSLQGGVPCEGIGERGRVSVGARPWRFRNEFQRIRHDVAFSFF